MINVYQRNLTHFLPFQSQRKAVSRRLLLDRFYWLNSFLQPLYAPVMFKRRSELFSLEFNSVRALGKFELL